MITLVTRDFADRQSNAHYGTTKESYHSCLHLHRQPRSHRANGYAQYWDAILEDSRIHFISGTFIHFLICLRLTRSRRGGCITPILLHLSKWPQIVTEVDDGLHQRSANPGFNRSLIAVRCIDHVSTVEWSLLLLLYTPSVLGDDSTNSTILAFGLCQRFLPERSEWWAGWPGASRRCRPRWMEGGPSARAPLEPQWIWTAPTSNIWRLLARLERASWSTYPGAATASSVIAR